MIQIALYEPEIPPNTGNIIRLCANTATVLHLIRPLGFKLEDKKLRRAGLDYHEWADVRIHDSLEDLLDGPQIGQLYAVSTKGKRYYHQVTYQDGDLLLFGPETRGLPATVLDTLPSANILRIPMHEGSRSLNLSNAAAIIVYEAWRQSHFNGST